MKRPLLIFLVCLAALVAAGAVTFLVLRERQNTDGLRPMEQVVGAPQETTDEHIVFQDETPVADPALVGRWRNAENPQWFKVYLDDYDDEEGYFWGKEWNEAEDVQETDLSYHGNGWFRWRKDGARLVELHTMDVHDIPVPKLWDCRHLTARTPDDSLVLISPERNTALHFSRIY